MKLPSREETLTTILSVEEQLESRLSDGTSGGLVIWRYESETAKLHWGQLALQILNRAIV